MTTVRALSWEVFFFWVRQGCQPDVGQMQGHLLHMTIGLVEANGTELISVLTYVDCQIDRVENQG